MYKNERYIYFYEAETYVVGGGFKGLPPFAHFELAIALRREWRKNKADYITKGSNHATYISEIKVFNNRAELLVGFADPSAADPTFNDHPARKRRTVSKTGREGLEHSAHIVWHYKTKTNTGDCPFYIEAARYLGSSSVTKFLNRILRQSNKERSKFERPHPSGARLKDGSFKQIKVTPKIELTGHPSAEFIADLKDSELSELELYTEPPAGQSWDSYGYTKKKKDSVLIGLNKNKQAPKAFQLLRSLLDQKTKKKYEKSRIKFKTRTEIRKSVTFYTDNFRLVNESGYVKKELVSIPGRNLPNAFGAIDKQLMDEIKDLAGL